jgi:hypothetical protein
VIGPQPMIISPPHRSSSLRACASRSRFRDAEEGKNRCVYSHFSDLCIGVVCPNWYVVAALTFFFCLFKPRLITTIGFLQDIVSHSSHWRTTRLGRCRNTAQGREYITDDSGRNPFHSDKCIDLAETNFIGIIETNGQNFFSPSLTYQYRVDNNALRCVPKHSFQAQHVLALKLILLLVAVCPRTKSSFFRAPHAILQLNAVPLTSTA